MPQRKDAEKLTEKRKAFADNLIKGMSQRKARAAAGYSTNMSERYQDIDACNIKATAAVQKYLAELQAQIEADALMTNEQIRADLVRIASDRDKPDGVRLKALDQLSRMQGGYDDGLRVDIGGGLSIGGLESQLTDLLD